MRAAELFGHWDEVRRDLMRAVDTLSDDDLSFVPREGLWSLGRVLCHIAGAEDAWFRRVRGQSPSDVDYDLSRYATVAAVKGLLDAVHRGTLATLGELDVADLAREAVMPWGEHLGIGWIIWHVLEHEIHHRGEIFLMLGLLGREAPDI